MTVKLALDGERIAGKDITLQVTYPISAEDLSGQSSSTEDAETGLKAKIIRVRMLVPHANKESLNRLHTLASQLDEDDTRHVYTIVCDTAEALDIRQVRFYGNLAVREHRSLKAWLTTFQLKEYRSVAQKKEEQAAQKERTELAQVGDGSSVQQADADSDNLAESFIDKWLAKGEEWAKEILSHED